MASWSEIEVEAPELAAEARRLLDAHVHKTIATLRRDGSPRISGTEVKFAEGELWMGSMPRSVKALDLQREPRFALHSGSEDPPGLDRRREARGASRGGGRPGAKGRRLQPATRPRASITCFAPTSRLVVTRVGEPPDHLVIEWWHAGRGVTRRERG